MAGLPESAASRWRISTLAIVLCCSTIGGLARWNLHPEAKSAVHLSSTLHEVRLSPQIGEVEDVLKAPRDGLKLRLLGCSSPVYAFPLWVTSTAVPGELDRIFADENFQSTDVYLKQISRHFTRVSLVYSYVLATFESMFALAKNHVGDAAMQTKAFVRYYFQAECEIPDAVLLAVTPAIIGTQPFTIP